MNTTRRHVALNLLGFLCAGLALCLLLMPFIGLLARVSFDKGLSLLVEGRTLHALRLSLLTSLSSTGLALVLGTPLAAWLARAHGNTRRSISALLTLPLVLPPVVAGVGLLNALGRRSALGSLLSSLGLTPAFHTSGAVLASTVVAAPLLILTLTAGFAAIDRMQVDAARLLGANRWMVLRHVVLPQLRPALRTGSAMCFARALGEFGATLTFAGNLEGKTQTMPLLIYETLFASPEEAALLSILLVAIALTAFLVAGTRTEAL